jgi:hypothetical protein
VIDFRYWWRTDKGEFAPPGGKNLAPRQFERQWRGGRPNDMNLASMAAEYRAQFPTKPLLSDFDTAGWAWVCAGRSLPRMPRTTDTNLLAAITKMQPWVEASSSNRRVLRGREEYLVCFGRGASNKLDLSHESGMFIARWVDPQTGETTVVPKSIKAERNMSMPDSTGVYWLTKE